MSQDEALLRMTKLVNSLLSRSDCGPFREPVDWRGLELYDYPKMIKKMMDLGTVKRKLERGQYRNASECAEDIRLVWKNCWTYNADGSDFWLLAKSFSRRFEDRYKKIQAEFDTGEGGETNSTRPEVPQSRSTRMSLEAKSQLASDIFLLSGMELAHVITTIELNRPEALEPVATGNATTQLEINIDALDGKTFTEIEQYVQDKVGSRPSADLDMEEEPMVSVTSASKPNKKRKR